MLHKRFAYINKNNLRNLIKNTISKYNYKYNKDKDNDNCCKIYIQAELPNQKNKQLKNKI